MHGTSLAACEARPYDSHFSAFECFVCLFSAQIYDGLDMQLGQSKQDVQKCKLLKSGRFLNRNQMGGWY
jgi:hypothetical protein